MQSHSKDTGQSVGDKKILRKREAGGKFGFLVQKQQTNLGKGYK
jgi:hypothetical protein